MRGIKIKRLCLRLWCIAGASITMYVPFGTGIIFLCPAALVAVMIVSSVLIFGMAGTYQRDKRHSRWTPKGRMESSENTYCRKESSGLVDDPIARANLGEKAILYSSRINIRHGICEQR